VMSEKYVGWMRTELICLVTFFKLSQKLEGRPKGIDFEAWGRESHLREVNTKSE
jgi:hypothetical protein